MGIFGWVILGIIVVGFIYMILNPTYSSIHYKRYKRPSQHDGGYDTPVSNESNHNNYSEDSSSDDSSSDD